MIQQIQIKPDFILDPSLALYLPLHELDGGAFQSRDAYGHRCAVSGAVWNKQGRTFDGIDDEITLPANLLPSGDWTMLAWLKLSAQSSLAHSYFKLDGGWNLFYGGTGANYTNKWGVEGTSNKYGNTAVQLNQWVFLGIAADAAAALYRFYHNGQPDGSAVMAVQSLTAAGAIGSRGGGYFWNGAIGEVRAHRRILTSLEIRQHYLATRWRYQ